MSRRSPAKSARRGRRRFLLAACALLPAACTTASPDAPLAETAPAARNSLDTIVADMTLMNDAELAGIPSHYGWSKGPGFVFMGNVPRGTNTPSWWKVDDPRFKSGDWWKAALAWLVVFDGAGNRALNTRVEVRDLEIYMKSKSSGSWRLLDHSPGVDGHNYPKSLQGEAVLPPDTRTGPGGGTAIRPPGGSLVYHGWGRMADVDGPDVAAIFVTLQARLVTDDPAGPDDRALARYLIHVGGDYYPDRSTRVSDLGPAYYFPGIGVSRAKLVTSEWQSFNFATVGSAVQDPGGSLTEAEFRSHPPPLR
jgi:hypothetical protein